MERARFSWRARMIAGLLLAAGRSSRFGSDKLCATLLGSPVIRLSCRALSQVDELIVVVPRDDAAVRTALAGMDVRFVRNAQRDSGMASSIRAGVAALGDHVEAVVIALADQPLARAAVTLALINRWRVGDADILAPRYSDGRGHPVFFARNCFEALGTLDGDQGARRLMDDARFRFVEVPVASAMPLDVDTPELLALAAQRASDDASMSPPSV